MMYESSCPEDTQHFAAKLAAKSKAGNIFCLCGNLGAGKTAFSQGFVQGLGYTGYVSSPTFTLMQIYEGGRLPVYHFDLYRLMEDVNADTLEEIGFFEYLDADGVCLIEWADCAREYMPDSAIWVDIGRVENGSDENKRKIHIRGL